MTAVLATKTALQAIPINQTRLHFVGENLAWYYGNPESTAQADGENVLTPATGPGRYLKQFSVNPQNSLIWQSVSSLGNFTATPNTGYIFDFTNIAGDVTVTLPSNPAIGTVVRLLYGSQTNIQRRLLINPAGALVNGQAGNFFIYRQNQQIDLVWQGSTLGWLYTSNLDFAPAPVGTVTTFAVPAATNLTQEGIINFFGRRFSLGNAYSNSFAGALSNNAFLFYACALGFNSNVGAVSNLGDRTNSSITLFSTSTNATSGPGEVVFLLPMNTGNFNQQYPIRLQSLYWQGVSLIAAGVTQVVIQGTNDFIESSPHSLRKPSVLFSNYSGRANRDLNGITSGVNWETISIISTASLSVGNGAFGNTANNAHIIPVGSGKYFTAHRMVLLYQSSFTPSIVIQELELYGDIIT